MEPAMRVGRAQADKLNYTVRTIGYGLYEATLRKHTGLHTSVVHIMMTLFVPSDSSRMFAGHNSEHWPQSYRIGHLVMS